MNDLDMQVAKAKGLTVQRKEIRGFKDSGILFFLDANGEGFKCHERTELWSTSDAKAFGLVDELVADGARFILQVFGEASTLRWKAFTGIHYVVKARTVGRSEDFPISQWKDFVGSGSTCAEAICRAYIAVKQHLAGGTP